MFARKARGTVDLRLFGVNDNNSNSNNDDNNAYYYVSSVM